MTSNKGKRDYSQGTIYKLCCLDTNVLEVYVGSTLCFYRRKYFHKYACTAPGHKYYNLRVYQFIRAHGGWDNWEMVQIEAYPATNKRDLECRERDCMERFSVTLNGKLPARREETMAEYKKNYQLKNKQKLAAHASEMIHCSCGASFQRSFMVGHSLTARHKRSLGGPRKKIPATHYVCDCGSVLTRKCRKKHNRSQMHQKYLESQASLDKA
jgi:hypothetical protein